MRTTVTIDDDVAVLLNKENRKVHEPMKQTLNRALRIGLQELAAPVRRKRFVVKPLDLGTTREQWEQWDGKSIHEILEEAEGPL